jgi:DNA invertase Pin-like site-specific DNA recombinase
MTTAAAYIRRSSADDENPGFDSRGRQVAAVQRMCGADVAIYEDWGVSGSAAKTDKRPEYARLKADIVAGRVSSVCAESLSRLGRSTRELLGFVDLCREHGVQVQTDKERVDTSGAMGRFLFTVMAAIGELELDMGKERSAGSRMARLARHEAAGALLPGGVLPGSVAAYGFVNVTKDGVTLREHDPKHPIEPIVDAFREAGTVRGACELLQARGISAPEGGAVWGSSTLSRILRSHAMPGCDHGLDLPDRNASGRVRRDRAGRPALFAGLLLCHCGRTMTPNLARGQYYCAGGRDSGSAQHGKYSTTEAALKAALWPEVARQYRAGPKPIFKERNERAILDLEARRERVAAAMLDGLIPAAKAKAETEAIDARLDKLTRQAGAWTGMFAGDAVLDLNDPDVAAQNALLRRLWLRVDMDATMAPHVQWVIDPDKARAEELEAERSYTEPDESGESRNDRELSATMAERYDTPERVNAALRRARKGAATARGRSGAAGGLP